MRDYSRKPVHIILGTNAGPEHEHPKSPSHTTRLDQTVYLRQANVDMVSSTIQNNVMPIEDSIGITIVCLYTS